MFQKVLTQLHRLILLLTFDWPRLLPSSPWIKANTDPDRESPQEASSRSACLIRRLRLFSIINMKRWEERIFSCCMWLGSWSISLLQAVTQSERGRSMCVSTHTLLSPRPASHHHINALEVLFFGGFLGLMRNYWGFAPDGTLWCRDAYFTTENQKTWYFFYPGGANDGHDGFWYGGPFRTSQTLALLRVSSVLNSLDFELESNMQLCDNHQVILCL